MADIQTAQHPAHQAFVPQQMPLTPDPPDEHAEVDDDSLDVLLRYPGARSLYFLRPDPRGLNRPTTFLLTTAADTTLADIREALLRQWPDLRDADHWCILEPNVRLRDSILIRPDVDPFLLQVSSDLRSPTSSPVVLELQTWDLRDGSFEGWIIPMVLENRLSRSVLLDTLDLMPVCRISPCTVMLNGQVHDLWTEVHTWSADYIRVGITTSPEHIRAVIVSPLAVGPLAPEDVPTGFADLVDQHYQQQSLLHQVLMNSQATHLQLALSYDAREIYLQARLHTITARHVGIFQITEGPSQHLRLWNDVHRDPFGFFLDLLARRWIDYDTPWKVFNIHPSVAQSELPQGYPYVGLLRSGERQHPQDQLVLTEVFTRTQQAGRRSQSLGWRLLLADTDSTGIDMVRLLGRGEVCFEHHCDLRVNGVQRPFHVPLQLTDGDFLQLWINILVEEPPLKTQRVDLATSCSTRDSTGPLEPSLSTSHAASSQHRSSSSSSFQGPPGLSLQLGSWSLLFHGLFSRRGKQNWRRAPVPCPSDRWCAGVPKPVRPSFLSQGTLMSLVFLWIWTFPSVAAFQISLPMSGRVGEAKHPGPAIWLGTANPSGLRSKEFQFAVLPTGIWGISETHIAEVGLQQTSHIMKCQSSICGSSRYFLPGAPVALRARSSTEGRWSGVAFLSDLPMQNLQIHWPAQEYSQGRVQLAQMWCGSYSLTGANVYLWPQSPTWPHALEASRQLLDTLTRELVYSRTGPRFIVGDFNHKDDLLPITAQWRDQGWVEVQDLAARLQGRVPTYRGVTTPDRVWVSPEMIQHFKRVDTWTLFADHLTLGAEFELPVQQVPITSWPLPTEIPWSQIDLQHWYASTQSTTFSDDLPVTDQYTRFWQSFEQSLGGSIQSSSGALPTNHCGRATRTSPVSRPAQCPILRPSRQGEVQVSTDFVGRAVQSWFRQLRRIQSLLHAVRADKQTGEAQIYRAELWQAIRRASGFRKSFARWWTTRPIRLQGAPHMLPDRVPTFQMVEIIWEDFHLNYQKFESWHVRRRRELLGTHMAANYDRIFQQIKPPSKQALSHLQESHMATIIGVSEDGTQIQMDHDLPTGPSVTYDIDDRPAQLNFFSQDMANVDFDGLIEPGASATATQHYSTFEEIDLKLRDFWQRRWIKDAPSEGDWQRILSFAAAYLPKVNSHPMPLDVDSWDEINRRYTPRSARGPDGVSRQDLLRMPSGYKAELVSILRRCEQQAEWPAPLLHGFTYPLPKREVSLSPGDFRPVIIYSMVYRSWSSHRSRRLLRHIQHLASSRQFGFMPETDSAEMWLLIQSMVEVACLENIPLHGYVTDIQKAFENLPRTPIKAIATQLRASSQILDLWFSFLENMCRRFVILSQVGEGLRSNHGFPEGCALSCYAMALVDISFHCYFRVYSSRSLELSYVDNMEIITFAEAQLQQGITCLRAWLDAWGLHLDEAKSYIWSTAPASRRLLSLLGWKVVLVEKDLGAPMSYGKRSSSSISTSRIATLAQLWPRLTRSLAPTWQKEKALKMAFWPRAFYGSANGKVAPEQIRQLRTEAMRALGHRRAGASPAARLFLLCDPLCDPGFYHAWHVVITFRRVACKRPVLVDLWRDFMDGFGGSPSYGPLSKLLDILGQVGWQMEVPHVGTQDGIWFDFVATPTQILYDHFVDAWAQQVSYDLAKRKDFENMGGIDYHVVRQGHKQVLPHQLGSLKCLQDGTFITSKAHSKFDFPWPAPANFVALRTPYNIVARPALTFSTSMLRLWDQLPAQHKIHLLPLRNPWWAAFHRSLQLPHRYIPPCLPGFEDNMEQVHLFVDGSCRSPTFPEVALASFAVVSATHDMLIVQGALHGGRQSSDRAELEAIIRCIEVAASWLCNITIWSDSAYASSGLARLLQDPDDIPGLAGSHESEWLRLRDAVMAFPCTIVVQHVPGHGDVSVYHQDFEDWASYWNHRADRAAAAAFDAHHPEVLRAWRALHAHHDQQMALHAQLQALHWDVASVYQQEQAIRVDRDMDDEDADGPLTPLTCLQSRQLEPELYWLDGLPDQWLSCDAFCNLAERFTMQWTRTVIAFLLECRNSFEVTCYQLSWLEIAALLVLKFGAALPVASSVAKGQWISSSSSMVAGRGASTAATALRLTRDFFRHMAKEFGLAFPTVQHLNLVNLGVYTPQSGISLLLSQGDAESAARAIQVFTSRRPVRTVNDFSRPFTLL